MNWNVKTSSLEIKNDPVNFDVKFNDGVKFLYINLRSPKISPTILSTLDSWMHDKLVERKSYTERRLVQFYSKLCHYSRRLPLHKRQMNGFYVAVLSE